MVSNGSEVPKVPAVPKNRVQVSRDAIARIIAHAREDAPNECCGLLAGQPRRVDEVVPCTNLDASPVRFRLDPKQHIDTNRRLRGSASAVVGAYHSHPASPAMPSETDVAEAHYPEFVWIIVSLARAEAPDVRAYSIVGGVVMPVEIVLT